MTLKRKEMLIITDSHYVQYLNIMKHLPKMAGTKHRQFVNIAPLTTSISGRMWKNRIASPIVWHVSPKNWTRNCENVGLFDDLK